jgi:hypothetical protein
MAQLHWRLNRGFLQTSSNTTYHLAVPMARSRHASPDEQDTLSWLAHGHHHRKSHVVTHPRSEFCRSQHRCYTWKGIRKRLRCSWWSSAIHIAVNALSTILLAVSNYTMQVLSSPTREDIDKAHAKHEHLDIGVLSVRNLTRIPRRRLLLFLLMGLSSIPIHLL